jgi:hypothetical protein
MLQGRKSLQLSELCEADGKARRVFREGNCHYRREPIVDDPGLKRMVATLRIRTWRSNRLRAASSNAFT